MASHSSTPCASIVIPTRMRLDYLQVALDSIAPQSASAGAELIVVDDAGPSASARELAERHGARYEPHPQPLGLNVARNTGVERSTGELLVFVDDDVRACEGWLTALLAAAREHPDVEVLTGPILPLLEGSPPHTCGRESPPITTLDLGPEDAFTRYAWGANMAIRRHALERVGPFDTSLEHGGDEQEWQERLHAERPTNGTASAAGVLYVAGAALHHRRSAADARLRPLCHAAFTRGKAARRFDAWRAKQTGARVPSLPGELHTLARCLGHVARYRCAAGLTMVAHSMGRLLEAIRERHRTPAQTISSDDFPSGESGTVGDDAPLGGSRTIRDDFLSGESGTVGGLGGIRRSTLDSGLDTLEIVSGRRRRLKLAARRSPPRRRVLILGIARPQHQRLVRDLSAELNRSRHEVELCLAPPGSHGKFENLNLLLDAHPPHDRDWLLVVDDDIVLPHGFLDRLLFLAEHFNLDLAQPAHRLASHAAWRVTRRRPGSTVRETRFVEIGPVTAFARSTFPTLLPFPDLRMGWGLDLHWAALAHSHRWRSGVIDAVAIGHRAAPAASSYSREQALAEARAFLEHRPYLSAMQAQQTLVTHRRW